MTAPFLTLPHALPIASPGGVRALVMPGVSSIDEKHWDSLEHAGNPFTTHAFLTALESSKSVGDAQTGWLPTPIIVLDGDTLLAAMPLYLRLDSYGEYIFDWAWADAASRAGLPYYPKLTASIPYTPATGRRLLRRADISCETAAQWLTAAALEWAERTQASGLHILFTEAQEAEALKSVGLTLRLSSQYHWDNTSNWRNFDDFVKSMRAPLRKNVRRERAKAHGHGLQITWLTGDMLSDADAMTIYALYRRTSWEKGAQAYLTASFFRLLPSTLKDFCHVAAAKKDGKICAMALFFGSPTQLYGRYWGSEQQWDSLHFELCYYAAIEYALAHGIKHIEAGAQGEHKLRRGLMPKQCHSAHWLAHPGLMQAVTSFVGHEAKAVSKQMMEASTHGPFHRQITD